MESVVKRIESVFKGVEACKYRVKNPMDSEAIHDLRVQLRHLQAVLLVLQNLYGKKAVRALKKARKSLQKVTGPVRDCEALIETIQTLKLSEEQKKELDSKVQMPIGNDLNLEEYLFSIQHLEPLDEKAFSRAIRKTVSSERKKLKKLHLDFQTGSHPVETLHKIRVHAKHIRYLTEMFSGYLPKKVVKLGTPTRRAQNAIGYWKDLESLKAESKRWNLSKSVRKTFAGVMKPRLDRAYLKAEKSAQRLSSF